MEVQSVISESAIGAQPGRDLVTVNTIMLECSDPHL